MREEGRNGNGILYSRFDLNQPASHNCIASFLPPLLFYHREKRKRKRRKRSREEEEEEEEEPSRSSAAIPISFF